MKIWPQQRGLPSTFHRDSKRLSAHERADTKREKCSECSERLFAINYATDDLLKGQAEWHKASEQIMASLDP